MLEMRKCVSAMRMLNQEVLNIDGEHIGEIRELMIDLNAGRVAYAVLSFGGGFVGVGNKLFAVPWSRLNLLGPDSSHEGHLDRKFMLAVTKEELENAPGFDKDHWPDMNDLAWLQYLYSYYDCVPYWQ
jgi:sporulation protein YlmC with PRC-barrel domain